MKIVLCGQLTNALTGRINRHFEAERWFPREHGDYYASLFRHTDTSYFDRAASLVAIAEETLVGSIDWAIPVRDQEGNYGISHQSPYDEEFRLALYQGSEALVDTALKTKAFSPESLQVLQNGGTERFSKRTASDRLRYARQQLREIVEAIVLAGQTGAMLVIGDDEEKIIRELSTFISKRGLPLPFEFPDMETVSFLTDETLPAALINFSAEDPSMIATVRSDKLVQRYSSRVHEAFQKAEEMDRKRLLVRAMREAAAEEKRIAGAETVIEMALATVRALQVPLAGLALAGVGWKLKTERVARSWHLLRARVAEVSVREYLGRTANQ